MSYNPPPNPNLKKTTTPQLPKSTLTYTQGTPITTDQLPPIHGKRDFKLASFVSVEQLNVLGMDHIMTRAGNIKSNPIKYNKLAKGKLMYSLFFSNSTRTRFSTETAWMRLGGTIINMDGAGSTSIAKGETIEHTLQMFAGYEPEFIAIRCSEMYLPHYASLKYPEITWINCGDGSNEHPTQAMLDLFTIKEKFEDLSKLTIAFVGDMKYGRTIKSLAKVLKQFETRMIFVAPESLHAKEELENAGIKYDARDIKDLASIVKESDIVYCCRPQIERMSESDILLYKDGVYQLDLETMGDSKALIMHPLPINSATYPEIHPELDSDPRSIYFEQAANGLWTRMSIMSLLMGI
jgi:aspartate carbamoyltransferase catalytic subunit